MLQFYKHDIEFKTHENKYKTHKHKKLVFQNKTENADLNKPVLKK